MRNGAGDRVDLLLGAKTVMVNGSWTSRVGKVQNVWSTYVGSVGSKRDFKREKRRTLLLAGRNKLQRQVQDTAGAMKEKKTGRQRDGTRQYRMR